MVSAAEPPAYQALLELEKGTSGSPVEQLAEAARITGVDLESYVHQYLAGDGGLPSITSALSAPTEEWVLRWLLKKLKGLAEERNEYRKNERSWILLRILFGRIPIRSLAFTLNENNFLAILQDSLVALESTGNEEKRALDAGYDSKVGAQLKRVPESDSSTRSRKRKRTDGGLSTDTPEADSSCDASSGTLLAIIESIHALVQLANQIPQAQISLRAQLKLVFRGQLKASAIILGQSCSHALTAIDEVDVAKEASYRLQLYSSLVSVVEIWALRSDSSEGDSSKSSNDLFVSHALVGVLGLIRNIHQSQGGASRNQELVNGLERLVVLHVVLHLRENFFSSESTATNNQISPKKVQLLSDEVQSRLGAVLSDSNSYILPTLFDVSIRAMPRNNFRRQLHENPWLESLAISLLARGSYSLSGERAANSSTRSVSLLQEFLGVAIQRKLKLSLETLVQITSGYSQLLSKSQSEIEWHLITQILKLDVDVFLLNSGLEQSATLLDSLLGGITSLSLQPESTSSGLYNTIKFDIVIPLARGFFNARDGSAFVRIWTEQLSRLETARRTSENGILFSVWEDDDVVNACGELLAADAQLDAQVEDILVKVQSTERSSLDISRAVIMGCLTTLLANNQAMAQLTSETRQLLFTNLLSTLGDEATSTIKSQLADIWSSFLSPQSVLDSSCVVDDIVKVVYDKLEQDAVPSKLLVGTLLSIPTRLVARPQRGSVLDLLQSFFLEGKVDADMKLDILLLMTSLMEATRSPAQITSDQNTTWAISRSIHVSSEDNSQLLFDAFRKFHEVVMDRFEAAPEDSVTKFMKSTYLKVTNEAASPNYQTMEYPLFILTLSFLHKRKQQLDSSKKFEAICSLRQKTFDALVSDIHSLARAIKKGSDDLDTVKLAGILCMLDAFQDLQQESKDSRKEISKLEEYMSRYNLPVQFQKQAKLQKVTSKAPSADVESRLLDCTILFPLEQLHGKDQRSLVHKVNLQLSQMKEETVVKLIHNLREADLSGEQSGYQLLLLGMAVLKLDPVQDRESLASSELSTAFTKVSAAFSRNTSIEAFSLAAEVLDTLLRSQSRSITQWNIDNLLANISLIASPGGPPIDAKFAGPIHTRLCKLLGTLFELYRQKLSGRFHLVLPIMQALLRCLFTRNQKTANSPTAGLTLPPWVGDSSCLEAAHGTQFSRLLSALCDPTVSSVQRQRGGDHSSQGLSDNTKKVKSLAGQYLQYLVMEYSSCQLRGYISPEMKAALMPGMYVVLDVMSQSTMRAMNAGMDSSSRAVFKTLYDDYVRFGKWDHN
ncbi:uncharacterized protein GIQ15_05321 [Arthroderma uncinatum]|uniref:uncharacterized protein n=1 Tax=Arthroderma uncinatum TaxID=74035 RepID=UPI00144ABFC0|nr:uncharacterized protein GIQ15_05321 [Arthroderma uncinatum]KAF3482562.1 hypothetical protein GIQ15_05321 [Arthroderma uncinatum]